jgi:hypothetical protein
MNSDLSREASTADRSALGLIGFVLAAATVLVTVTAAVAVSDYRGGEMVANLPVAAAETTLAR